ncbi:MAG: inositol oxygenase [Proteobacteria bacterium]|nr:inositol oxygenase [Pseudomonadota bacterium]
MVILPNYWNFLYQEPRVWFHKIIHLIYVLSLSPHFILFYSTKYGMYEPNCGLDKVLMSFGHDEYLYRVLTGNERCKLPEESLAIVRFHSFYPWHTGGDYDHLCNDKDRSMLKWIREFK